MSRLNPIETNKMTPQTWSILDTLHFGADDAPNFLRVLAKSLAAMRAYSEVENALAGGQLTARQREQIALTVAAINGSEYCLAAHSIIGASAGLSAEDVQLAREAKATDPQSNAILAFTLAVVLQRGEIKDEGLKGLRRAGLSESEIIEIVANIAINIFTNYLNLISKTEADFPPSADAQQRNGDGRFVGKEVDFT